MRYIYPSFFLIPLLMILMGCSQKFQDVNHSVAQWVTPSKGAELSSKEISNIPYASLYATIGNRKQAFMVLAFTDSSPTNTNQTTTPELKWLSKDNVMIVTQHGRIIRTRRAPDGDLIQLHATTRDPLQQGLHRKNTPTTWHYQLDWQPGYHFGYQAHAIFTRLPLETIKINHQSHQVLPIVETVTVTELQLSYDNLYWLHPQTGSVLKSKQIPAPNLPYIELVHLKRYRESS